MNTSDEQHGAQGATNDQVHAGASTQDPNHVCTDACTHQGATKGGAMSTAKSRAQSEPAATKADNETVSMGSPAFGLGGRPVPKDAIHNNS